jgi:RsmE family RNA methyltransferase
LQVTLAVSLIRAKRFEWLLQKATEIGVRTIVPIMAERSVHDGNVSPTKRDRWQRIIREAAEQSCRGLLPELASPVAPKSICVCPLKRRFIGATKEAIRARCVNYRVIRPSGVVDYLALGEF